MGKLNLLILDGDVRYMENLSGYISGHYRHRFNVQTFTNAGLFLEYIQQKDAKADILLISAEESGEWLTRIESGIIILMTRGAGWNMNGAAASDGGDDGDKTGAYVGVISGTGAGPAGNAAVSRKNPAKIDRYCGADKLVIQILRIYETTGRQSADTGDIHGGRENKVIVVSAAEGGAGKTAVALALGAHYSRLKLKTLYVSLDYLNPGRLSAENGRGGLSDVIYTIKTRPDNLGLKLESTVNHAPGYGFYFIEPTLYPMDIDEISDHDIEALIAKLRGAGIYDRAVIDTHNGISMRNKTLFELADGILVLASGSPAGRMKLLLYKEQIDKCFGEQAIDIYKRCHIVLNRIENPDVSTAVSAEITGAFSAGVTAIPYCESLKDGLNPETLSGMYGSFGASIAEIAHRI